MHCHANSTKYILIPDQWFLAWGKFTPGDKFHIPTALIY